MSSAPFTLLIQTEGGGAVSLTPDVLQAIIQTCSVHQIDSTTRIVIEDSSCDDLSQPVLELTPDHSNPDVTTQSEHSQENLMQNARILHDMSVVLEPIQHEESMEVNHRPIHHDSVLDKKNKLLLSDQQNEPNKTVKEYFNTVKDISVSQDNHLGLLSVQASSLVRVSRTNPCTAKSLEEIITAAKLKKMNEKERTTDGMSSKYGDENTCNEEEFPIEKQHSASNMEIRSNGRINIATVGKILGNKTCIKEEGSDSEDNTMPGHGTEYDVVMTTCDRCDKVFSGLHGSTLLVIHQRYCKDKKGMAGRNNGDLDSALPPAEPTSENVKASYACKICGKAFERKYNLDRHLQSRNVHQNNVRKKYVPKLAKCDVCQKVFQSSGALNVHKKIHDEALRYTCLVCSRKFTQLSNMRQHMKTIHEGIKDEVCNICGKQFSNMTGLLYHKQKIHLEELMTQRYMELGYVKNIKSEVTDDDPSTQQIHVIGEHKFNCPVCVKGFMKVFSWFAHLNLHLTISDLTEDLERTISDVLEELKGRDDAFDDVTLYPCDACDYVCFNKSDMQLHMNRHSEHRPFLCQYCHVTFASKTECSSHEQYHTKKFRHRCMHCNAGFPFLKQLRMHQVKVHNIADDSHSGIKVVHRCQTCDLVFAYKGLLKKHMDTTHLGLKIFKCDLCDKTFGTKYGAQVHRRTHVKTCPYVCPICNKTFSDPSNLIHHGRRVHQDVPSSTFKQRRLLLDSKDPSQSKRTPATVSEAVVAECVHGSIECVQGSSECVQGSSECVLEVQSEETDGNRLIIDTSDNGLKIQVNGGSKTLSNQTIAT